MFTGYNDVSTIPFKRGDKVRIPKGPMTARGLTILKPSGAEPK